MIQKLEDITSNDLNKTNANAIRNIITIRIAKESASGFGVDYLAGWLSLF